LAHKAKRLAHPDALRQLGAFYAARGSRAALTPDVRDVVLAALRDADAALDLAPL
jgi:hypothetical protein